MPPLAASSQQRAPLRHGARAWLLAGTGAVGAILIGSFLANEKLPSPSPLSVKSAPTRHSSAVLAAGSSSFLPTHKQTIASSATAHVDDAPAWSEEEKERIRNWAQSAPRAAAEWATVLPPGSNRHFVLETAAITWGDSDPAAAAQWAQSLGDEAERMLALTDIAGEAVRSAPTLAIEIASTLPDAARDEILPRAAREWAAKAPAAAADWARQIPGEALRASVLAGITTVWSEQNPATAASVAVKELPAGRLQSDTIVSIVQRWAQQSPADAQAWVEQFPKGDLREAAMEALGNSATAKP
jgi:hypothetical protein